MWKYSTSVNYLYDLAGVALRYNINYDYVDTVDLFDEKNQSLVRGSRKKTGISSNGTSFYYFVFSIPAGSFSKISYIRLNIKQGYALRVPESVLLLDMKKDQEFNYSNVFMNSNNNSFIDFIAPKFVDQVGITIYPRPPLSNKLSLSNVKLYDLESNELSYTLSQDSTPENLEKNLTSLFAYKLSKPSFVGQLSFDFNDVVSPAMIQFVNRNMVRYSYNVSDTISGNYNFKTIKLVDFTEEDIEGIKYVISALLTENPITDAYFNVKIAPNNKVGFTKYDEMPLNASELNAILKENEMLKSQNKNLVNLFSSQTKFINRRVNPIVNTVYENNLLKNYRKM
jgi:hypothetical protein